MVSSLLEISTFHHHHHDARLPISRLAAISTPLIVVAALDPSLLPRRSRLAGGRSRRAECDSRAGHIGDQGEVSVTASRMGAGRGGEQDGPGLAATWERSQASPTRRNMAAAEPRRRAVAPLRAGAGRWVVPSLAFVPSCRRVQQTYHLCLGSMASGAAAKPRACAWL